MIEQSWRSAEKLWANKLLWNEDQHWWKSWAVFSLQYQSILVNLVSCFEGYMSDSFVIVWDCAEWPKYWYCWTVISSRNIEWFYGMQIKCQRTWETKGYFLYIFVPKRKIINHSLNYTQFLLDVFYLNMQLFQALEILHSMELPQTFLRALSKILGLYRQLTKVSS